ncbi:MAG: ABC transporter substrate-binding protein [Anaerolineales bacterium]
MFKNKLFVVLSLILVAAFALSACGGATPTEEVMEDMPAEEEAVVEEVEEVEEEPAEEVVVAESPGLQMEAAAVVQAFWSDEEYQESISWTDDDVLNPDAPLYLQSLLDNKVDTTEYMMEPPYDICFSNAGVNNSWRVTGYVTMREQVEQLRDQGLVRNFIHVDAEGSDEKQIADIEDLLAGGQCDALIVSPNSTNALTPIVEQACEVLPVVVFDRGVLTDCPVTFLKTIGGYKFGYDGAKFIVDNLPDGGDVLALRILPGVDVLEQRWGAALEVFADNPQINVIGVEFGAYSNPDTKGIVADYIDRFGNIDAIWMDAGGTAVGVLEAFEDAGLPFPIMVGEDQMDYLKFWKENDLTAIAPTFPTYQWRTAVLAAVKILQGEEIDARWVLPQPNVTQENLDEFYLPDMPPLYYAMSGAEDMDNWPDAWKELDTTKYIDVIE